MKAGQAGAVGARRDDCFSVLLARSPDEPSVRFARRLSQESEPAVWWKPIERPLETVQRARDCQHRQLLPLPLQHEPGTGDPELGDLGQQARVVDALREETVPVTIA